MNACKDFELALSLRAAAALDPEEAARLEAHLAGCPACRAESDAVAETLSLAKLPPVSDAERVALADVPRRALAELHQGDRRSATRRRILAGIAVAAAAGLAAIAPAVLRHAPQAPPEVVAAATPTWQAPDLDTVWEDAALVSLDASAVAEADGSDAALAALDFDVQE